MEPSKDKRLMIHKGPSELDKFQLFYEYSIDPEALRKKLKKHRT